ncbi:MAG TPA: transcriptional repressor [Chloroflexota bacterium]|nr:transcriptional repressor [Chloroflexota bacterium]
MCTSTDPGVGKRLATEARGQIVAALQGRGLRLTTQREAVCEAIFGCSGHICAEHILESVTVHHPGLRMNKTTVYRALDLLLELGLVSEHKCGDGRAQYEPASHGPHSHMICRRCGRLLDMDESVASAIRRRLGEEHGFQVELESYPVFGLCPECRT